MERTWGAAPVEPLDRLVHLSHRIGQDDSLVQPGGGNSSVKLRLENPFGEFESVLAVKGSGTDLRTIRRAGFTRLSLSRLDALRRHAAMSDEEMMSFMAACMLHPDRDPVPSVETPLHSVLPAPVILHTHDVVTMSLTNLSEADGRRRVSEAFGDEVVYLPYVRPGFPLARAVIDGAASIPASARGLALAHHGLVIWGDDAEEIYERLYRWMARAEELLASRRAGRRAVGVSAPTTTPRAAEAATADGIDDSELRRRAKIILPIVRGALGAETGVIVAWDREPALRRRLEAPSLEAVTRRGMATPEHILRAGAWPLWLQVDFGRTDEEVEGAARAQLRAERGRYEAYHARHAAPGQAPLEDWAKVVLVPGLGLLAAFRDRTSAETAATCYRAGLASLENAERLGGFEFIPEADVFFFEHWPLERRKVEEAVRREKQSLLLARHVALIVGGGSGIGAAAALRFAEEGAHVVIADLDAERAGAVAAEVAERFPGRAIGVAADARDDASLEAAVEAAVLRFGGLDDLFYTAGLAPRFAPLADLGRADLNAMLEVHYAGALLTLKAAAAVMRRQGRGGAAVFSVSKAALAPGAQAAAYGGSKAALMQALRVAAVELGPAGIRVNAINADQVETPLFLRFAAARAAARGLTLDDQLETYRRRNVLGTGLIPPSAVADIAALLCSHRLRYTTGDILTIDGGLPEAFPR